MTRRHSVLYAQWSRGTGLQGHSGPVGVLVYSQPLFEKAFRAFLSQDTVLAKSLCNSFTPANRHKHWGRLLKLIKFQELGGLTDGYCRRWVGWEEAVAHLDFDDDTSMNAVINTTASGMLEPAEGRPSSSPSWQGVFRGQVFF